MWRMQSTRPPTLETPRLTLNLLREDDADALSAVLGDAHSMRYYPAPLTLDDTRAWIGRQLASYAEHGHGLWAVRLNTTGELIGDTGLIVQDIDGVREIEVAWHIHPAHQRRGYATEAGTASVTYAFQTLGLPHVISLIRPENLPSQRVAEKLGMHVDRTTVRGPGWLHNVWKLGASA